jgi:hypothetical protein
MPPTKHHTSIPSHRLSQRVVQIREVARALDAGSKGCRSLCAVTARNAQENV